MTYTWPFPEGTPISQPFGSNPSNGFNPPGGHTGTDFAVPPGTPIMAIGAGIVRAVGQLPEPYTSNAWWIEGQWAGNVVIIDHGPVVSVYAHLSEWHVNLGDTVNQGQVIALSGATGGASTGPHCHFETLPDGWDFNNGTYGRVNPNTFCTGYWDGSTINPQSIPTQETDMPITDDDAIKIANTLLRFQVDKDGGGKAMLLEVIASYNAVMDSLIPKIVNGVLDAPIIDVKTGKPTSIRKETGWGPANFANIPGNVWNAPITGTGNAAGVLANIDAKPATVTNTSAPAAVDVDTLVARLKAELPAAIRADIAAKLTN